MSIIFDEEEHVLYVLDTVFEVYIAFPLFVYSSYIAVQDNPIGEPLVTEIADLAIDEL